jgi:uncharacterized protein with gpF-like domain
VQVCLVAEGHHLIGQELLQAAVQNAMRSVVKNKQRGLLKGWSDANGSWLTKYSKEIVQIAARQLGVQFGDAVRAAAGLNDAVCFTLANQCKFKLDSISLEFQEVHAIMLHQHCS